MPHPVKCFFCGETFDRDIIPHALMNYRRYAHAECMLEAAKKDKSKEREVIDPIQSVICFYCRTKVMKSEAVDLGHNNFAHKACVEYQTNREKTDEEKLEEYIIKLFDIEYVYPNLRKEVQRLQKDYGYTPSGILGTLKFFYEVQGNEVSSANMTLGIVPYVYRQAKEYYYNLWLIKQKHQNLDINKLIPKVKEITIAEPVVKKKEKDFFSFLDEEESD